MTAYEVHWTINGKTEVMHGYFTSRAVAIMHAERMEMGRTGIRMADHYTYTVIKVTI